MDEQDKALDLILHVEENNAKNFFDIFKQLEYKAYINITLSGGFLAATINGLMAILNLSKSDYNYHSIGIAITAMFIAAILIPTLFTIYYSYQSLSEFDIKNLLYDEYINSNNINNFALLKSDLLIQIRKKEIGLVDTYNKKTKYLNWSTKSLMGELGMIFGGVISFFITRILR